jgi:hypothetical protein
MLKDVLEVVERVPSRRDYLPLHGVLVHYHVHLGIHPPYTYTRIKAGSYTKCLCSIGYEYTTVHERGVSQLGHQVVVTLLLHYLLLTITRDTPYLSSLITRTCDQIGRVPREFHAVYDIAVSPKLHELLPIRRLHVEDLDDCLGRT